MNRRSFLSLGGAAALGLGLYSGEFERHDVEITEHALSLPRLKDGLQGLRVVQMSDVHLDEYSEPYYIRKCVERVNAMRPDMVLLTGDFVSYGPLPKSVGARHAHPCAEILSKLECPLRYAVMGNHDAEVGAPLVTNALESYGIPVLENRYVPIERDGERMWLAGVGSVTARRARLELAVPSNRTRGSEPVLLMAHEPDFADHAAQYGGVDVMLSGHTHGGQVRLPLVGPLVLPPFGQKYVEGFFQVGRTRLYVNRGIGTVGLPVRFMCRPEITLFTLAAAA